GGGVDGGACCVCAAPVPSACAGPASPLACDSGRVGVGATICERIGSSAAASACTVGAEAALDARRDRLRAAGAGGAGGTAAATVSVGSTGVGTELSALSPPGALPPVEAEPAPAALLASPPCGR